MSSSSEHTIKPIWRKCLDCLTTLLHTRIAFWSNGLFDVDGAKDHLQFASALQNSPSKWVVIVGREHYFESFKDYPIGNLRDLKKVVKNEVWSFPFEGIRFSHFERLSEQMHRVTSWVVKSEVLDSLTSVPWFLVPETACVAALPNIQAVSLGRLGKKLHVANVSSGLVSSIFPDDESRSSLSLSMRDHFKSSINTDAEWVEISAKSSPSFIIKGMGELIMRAPFRFLVPIGFDFTAYYPWAKALKLCASLGLCYLLLTSMYLRGLGYWLDHRIHSIGDNAETSLELRRDIVRQTAQLESVEEVLTEVQPLWAVWDILLDLAADDVTFSAINGSDSGVVFYAQAARASEVLSRLLQDSRVVSAEYAAPVSQQGEGQRFAIRVKLKKPGFLTQAQISKPDEELIEDLTPDTNALGPMGIKNGEESFE